MAPRVVLIGPPGAGKSVVGAALASLWSVDVRDTDADVEALAGKSVADLFVEEGEARFRDLERGAVVDALAHHNGVLSLGGGAPLNLDTQRDLTAYAEGGGAVVFLDVSLTAVVPRVGLNVTRPLLLGNPRQRWVALMNERRPVYEALATMTVLTDDLDPREVAGRIAQEVS